MPDHPNQLRKSSRSDANGIGLYAKRGLTDLEFWPLLTNSSGELLVNTGGGGGATLSSSSGTMSLTLGTLVPATAGVATKVYAFSLTTTVATAGLELAFMAGTTRLWQVILQNASGSSTGANLANPTSSPLFSTVLTNTTLSLSCGTAAPVHFAVAYVQE